MMYVVPFEAAHFHRLEAQDAQRWVMKQVAAMGDVRLLENEFSATLMQDGTPLVCAGVVEFWKGRAHVCAMVSKGVTAANFAEVHRRGVEFLDGLPFRRLEAAVDVNFEQGHRWMRLLSFTCEAPLMRAYEVDGRDCALYARVRG